MNDVSPDAAARSRLLSGGVAVAAAVVLILLASTCKQEPSSSNNSGAGQTEAVTEDQCDRILEGVLDGLRPERLEISSDLTVLLDSLNNWLTECASEKPVADEEDVALRARLLLEAVRERTEFERFTRQDVIHIRNQLLARGIVDAVTVDARSDRERVVALFNYVIRTVDLAADDNGVPMTPFDVLVLGIGTAKDRAWVYASLLRQLRLDAVVVQPRAGDEPAPSSKWLLGVILPADGVYLFDCRLGLPVPSLEDDATNVQVRQPATLREARANDEVLRQLDTSEERPYPWSADDLQAVQVLAIGDSSLLALRMGRLQLAVDERGLVHTYDSLGPSELRPTGLIGRIAQAGADGLWEDGDIALWDYPETRWSGIEQLTPQQAEALALRYRVLQGPIVLDLDNIVETEQGSRPGLKLADRSLREARILQLLGDFEAASSTYLQTRIANEQTGRQIDRNREGADWAEYWVAACHYEQDEYAVAADSLQRYIKTPRNWASVARYLLALSLAQQERWEQAAEILAAESPAAPQHAGNQWLSARWRRLASASSPPDGPPESTDSEGRTADEPPHAGERSTDDAPSETDPPADSPSPEQQASPEPVRPPLSR